MYYDELLETVVDNENLSTDMPVNKKNSLTSVSRKSDPNYEKYSVPFNNTWKDGRFYKNITIELYGSGQNGCRIRNAVTGQRYEYIVGSQDEDLFFKVSDATGRYGRNYPLILYYDSPEQYENQHFITLSDNIKSVWNDKYMLAMQRMRLN
jgi:hypothetical protein